MTAVIVLLVCATIAIVAFVLQPKLGARRLVFAETPDAPKPFGYRMSWLAIKTTDTAAVLDAMALTVSKPANWNAGIGTVYDDRLSDDFVFVSPPVAGWTFVVGLPLPHPVGRTLVDKMTPLLHGLAQRFPDVQYFAAFPIIDFFGWTRFVKGRPLRAFVIGEDGVIWDRGRLTAEERALGLRLFDLRGIKGRQGDAGAEIVLYPTEKQVIRIASAWSCNPLAIGTANVAPATGFMAAVPPAWRAERISKAA